MTDPVLAPVPDAEVPQVREIPPAPRRSDAIDPDVWTEMAEARLAAEPLRDADMSNVARFANRCASVAIDSAQEASAQARAAAESAEAAGVAASESVAAAENLAELNALWLGPLPADPAAGKGGVPLVAGNAYVNTVTGYIRAYNGMGWVQGVGVVAGVTRIAGLQGEVTKQQLGVAGVRTDETLPAASIDEMRAGAEADLRAMSPELVAEAVRALSSALRIGDALQTAGSVGGDFLPCDGSVYLQSSYPELFAELGALQNPWDSSWSSQVVGTGSNDGAAYGLGIFVVVGANGILTSSDGVSWVQRSNVPLRAVAYGAGKFVAVGDSGQNYSSVDGVSWVQGSTSVVAGVSFYSICHGAGLFVAVGNNTSSAIATSTDGVSWTLRSTGAANLRGVTHGGGIFVAVGEQFARIYSVNGVDWLRAPGFTTGTNALRGVAYGKGVFCAVSSTGGIYTSADGELWSAQVSPSIFAAYAITFTGEVFLAVGLLGLMYSADGENWNIKLSGSFGQLNALAFSDDKIVSCGSSGAIRFAGLYSYDRHAQFCLPLIDGNDSSVSVYLKSRA